MSDASPERWMRRAIALSRRGFPAPNPHVGCVVVRDGQVVGEGYHDHAGGPHAEAVALAAAGDRARGADLYVTLEPCNHQGRTPPCSQAVVRAGVRRVWVAVPDPNPQASGGAETLRTAGVEVQVGLLEEEARKANEPFLTAMTRRHPFVTAKMAITADGFIAHPDGSSKWITNDRSRRAGHRLRAEMGAVLVGRRTVELDRPQLTARVRGVVNQPVRVVLDPHARLSGDEEVLAAPGKAVWIVGPGLARDARQVEVPAGADGADLRAVLDVLWTRGVTGLLVEGGAATVRAFLDAGLVDRLELFVAPKLFGEGIKWVGPGREIKLSLRSVRRHGEDVQLSYDLVNP